MSIQEKIEAVMTVYRELDHEIKSFQQWSGLGCPAGCGKCCYKSDLEATTLEFTEAVIRSL